MFGQLFSRFRTFRKSLDKSVGYDISTPKARRRAYLHLQWIDHGILRKRWTNLFEIAPGAWRSNQPDRDRIARYHQMGIKTVVNLRGTAPRSPFLFEREACEEFGLTMINHTLNARSLVPGQNFLDLLDTFETVEKPFVMHCKSGADRAGLASAMYLLHIEGGTIEEARKQLSFKYLHIKSSKTGVLDHFLDAYGRAQQESGISLRDWITDAYDPQEMLRDYQSKKAKG